MSVKPAKKISTKLIVDQYDKFLNRPARPKMFELPHPSSQYEHYLEDSFQQRPTSKIHTKKPVVFKKQVQKHEQAYEMKPTTTNNENFYDLLSQEDEDQFKMLLERTHNKETGRNKGKNTIVEHKKEEKRARNNEIKHSQYFPQQIYQKSKVQHPQVKQRRPMSSMVKKQIPSNPHKAEKDKGQTLKRVTSTSKFKQDKRKTNQSVQKQRQGLQSSHVRAAEASRNHVGLRKNIGSQHQVAQGGSRLKKKNVNLSSKPMRLEEVYKPISQQNIYSKVSKVRSQQYAEPAHHKKQQQKQQRSCPQQPVEAHQNIHSRRQPKNLNRREFSASSSQVDHPGHERRQESETERVPVREQQNVRQQRMPQNHNNRRPMNAQSRRQGRPRPQQAHPRMNQQERRPPRRNRNARPQQANRNNGPNFMNFFSQTINDQLQLMNNQFSMMSNIFQNFSNFVNINIDTRGNHFHLSSHLDSSQQYDTDSSASFSSDYDSYNENSSQNEGGLNEFELNMIQKIIYKSTEHGSNQCTICLLDLKNGDEAKRLYCEHIFHGDCIDEWLKRKSDCPVCRDKQ